MVTGVVEGQHLSYEHVQHALADGALMHVSAFLLVQLDSARGCGK